MSSLERYHRQIVLKGFGEAAQKKLLNAKVLVVGAGGLGCPALQYLTAAGIGTIGIIDDDVVSLSNLHRQTLYTVHDIGQSKAEKAVAVLKQMNPDVNFHSFNVRLTPANAIDILESYELVLDGSDNFATRYLVNDACVLLNKTLVYGAVSQYEGQVAIFNCKTDPGKAPVNYRDLFPEPPVEGEVLNCEEAGVLGVVPGIIGTMMANEAIKLITGIGTPVIDKLITYDALSNRQYEFQLTAREETRSFVPVNIAAFKNMNYEWLCSRDSKLEINNELFNELLQTENVTVIDVRESNELPRIDQFEHLEIPMIDLHTAANKIKSDTVLFFCQSGNRSLQAAQKMNKFFGDTKKIYSLKGGIVQWLNQQKERV